jgi:DNA-binding transcriptional LysR family regulator
MIAAKRPFARGISRTPQGRPAQEGSERHLLLQELQRRHDQMRGAVAPGGLQLQHHLPGSVDLHALVGQSRAADVAAQLFQPLAVVGEAFYRRCKPLLGEMREAETAVNEAVLKPTGLLRVQASLSFSMIVIAPLLPEFNACYPELRIEVVASNRYQDLLESGIDVAIRNREFEGDSAITVRRLAETKRVLAASPQYVQRHGTPRRPEELAQHRLLIYNLANQPHQLRFTRNGAETSLPMQGVLEANDGQILRAAAIRHLGILMQPMYIIHDDVVAGRLVPVLIEWELQRLTINIAYPTRRHRPAKVRCFVDFLVEQFAANDFERRWTA